eukprot:14762169-Heterocapsa_arctica.AAC.1
MRWKQRHLPSARNLSDADSRLADRGIIQVGERLSGAALRRRLARAGVADTVPYRRDLAVQNSAPMPAAVHELTP